MLSPVISDVDSELTSSLNEILQIDNYAYTCNNLRVGKLAKDPDWLATVRQRIAMLSDLGASWINERPEIWSGILVQFPNYATAFAGLAANQKGGVIKTSEEWIKMLKEVLSPQLAEVKKNTDQASDQLNVHYQQFKNVLPLLQESIEQGWQELAGEEKQMVKIAGQLGSLQTTVSNLEQQITSDAISSGKGYISSAVTISYELVSTVGESIPFLSIASAAITIGKMFYDIISNTEKVGELLEEIGKLQVEASEEAQAAAGTKAVLQTLYEMEKSFLAINDVLPQISRMWQTESDKVQAVIQALESGASPDNYFEIISIPTADANWQKISQFATDIANLQHTVGKPVVLKPGPSKVTKL